MIPFNRPSFGGREIEYLTQAVVGGHTSGNGAFTKRAEAMLSEMHDGRSALLTTSCTHALEMAARLLDLQPDDEVIVPAYTFVSTASAFMWNGARPVFADIRPDTLNIDPDSVESLITSRTKAICLVHYAGIGADPDRFVELANRHGIRLIEDNAHGLAASYGGRTLGTFGDIATLSFHETKNVTCGEGGAIVLNDPVLERRAEILREKGTNRSLFIRGQVDKYTWVDNGSSWVLSDLLAGVLVGQLERFEAIQDSRMAAWQRYFDGLHAWSARNDVMLPVVPEEADHSAHMFFLRLPDGKTRDRFIDHMRKLDVLTVFHYQPLNVSPMGSSLGGAHGQCPVSEDVAERLVRLPLYTDMSNVELSTVIEAVRQFSA